jgi:hypothetical protein
MIIIQFADKGNLRNNLSKNFNNIMWKDKILLLCNSLQDLNNLHKSGYFHKDFIVEISYKLKIVLIISHIFQTLDYLDQQMNKNQMIKYME